MPEPLSDNAALNEIVAQIERLNDFVAGRYETITGDTDQVVSLAAPFTRNADPTAVKTVIVNKGSVDVRVFEEGILVAIVPPGYLWESPLSGGLEITVDTAGSASTISIATYIKE